MPQSFLWIPPDSRGWALGIGFVVATGFAIALKLQGKSLTIPGRVPRGVVSFELARTKARAGEIIDAWASLIPTAKRQLLIDFGFLVAYPFVFALSCHMLAHSGYARIREVGVFIAWAVLFAGPLDAIENCALLRMLHRGTSETMAGLACGCAAAKFALLLVASGYLVVEGFTTLVACCFAP